MKRVLSFIICLLLIASLVWAGPKIYSFGGLDNAKGITRMGSLLEDETEAYLVLPGVSLTQAQIDALDTNIKAIKYGSGITLASLVSYRSDVNGAAFITQPSVDLRAYIGFKVTGADGAIGWIKAAGAGETLGSELITTWTNNTNPAHAYDTFTSSGKDITSAIRIGVNFGSASFGVQTAGALIKSVVTTTVTSGTLPYWGTGSNSTDFATDGAVMQLVSGANTVYLVPTTAFPMMGVYRTAAQNYSAVCSSKQVLTASDTGVKIANTQGGTTYNWATVGTTPNAASLNYTITRD